MDEQQTATPTVHGPLANEILDTPAGDDHKFVHDCLATLANRLENLEVVVYASVQPDNTSTNREQSDTESVSHLEKIGLLAIAADTAKQELFDAVIPECSKLRADKDQVFPCWHYDSTNDDCQPCQLYRRLHSNVKQTDDALILAIKSLSNDEDTPLMHHIY